MIGPERRKPSTLSGMENSTLQSTDCRPSLPTCAVSPAPPACPPSPALPIARAESAEIKKNIICKALPTPAIATAPRPATSTVSTIPSSVSRKFSPMTGPARLHTRLRSSRSPVNTVGWLGIAASEVACSDNRSSMVVIISISAHSFYSYSCTRLDPEYQSLQPGVYWIYFKKSSTYFYIYSLIFSSCISYNSMYTKRYGNKKLRSSVKYENEKLQPVLWASLRPGPGWRALDAAAHRRVDRRPASIYRSAPRVAGHQHQFAHRTAQGVGAARHAASSQAATTSGLQRVRADRSRAGIGANTA